MVSYFQSVVGLGAVFLISINLDRQLDAVNHRNKFAVAIYILGAFATLVSIGFALFALWYLGDGHSWDSCSPFFRFLSAASGALLIGGFSGHIIGIGAYSKDLLNKRIEGEQSKQLLQRERYELEEWKRSHGSDEEG